MERWAIFVLPHRGGAFTKGETMTTHKRIDVAELAELLAACREVAELADLHLKADARHARDRIHAAIDKITVVIDEITDDED